MKVFIHIEEIFPRVPLYHVGVGYKWGPIKFRHDFHPEQGWGVRARGRMRKVELGKSKKNIFEVYSFQKKLQEQKYFLGFRDCRHFSQELLDFSYVEDYNVINVFNLHELFTCTHL